MKGFTLRKSYLDVVDDRGRAAIAYWASCRFGALRFCWQAVSFHEPGRPALHRAALGRTAAPSWSGDTLTWRSERIATHITCERSAPAYAARLLDEPSGQLEWRCESPAGRTEIAIGGVGAVRGLGYAEELVLTTAPWKLPIRELRWGRWAGEATGRSMVWIEWTGRHPLTLGLVDGARADMVIDSDHTIRTRNATLALGLETTIYSRSISEIVESIPGLGRRLPTRWLTFEDRKVRSRGTLLTGEGAMDGEEGWAIHETVRFP